MGKMFLGDKENKARNLNSLWNNTVSLSVPLYDHKILLFVNLVHCD